MSFDLSLALPERFPFFHLGEVALELDSRQGLADDDAAAEDRARIAFRLLGELEGWLVIAVDAAVDLSMYSELGNILASQLANRLHRDQGREIMISPPEPLDPERWESLLASLPEEDRAPVRRRYLHAHDGRVVPVDTWIFARDRKGVGHA